MDIYLIRHADAVPIGTDSVETDEARPLSERGWKQAADLARAFRRLNISLDTIVTSPLVRAHQTAQQLRTVLELGENQLEIRDELAPGGRPRKLARALNGLQGNSIALVGHMPDMGEYAAWMLGEKTVQIHFSKGASAYLRFKEAIVKGGGELMWLATPELIA